MLSGGEVVCLTISVPFSCKFETGSASGELNNGALVAHIIGIVVVNVSHCISSQLYFFVNRGLNNKTITCLHSYDISEIVDTMVINITTGTC